MQREQKKNLQCSRVTLLLTETTKTWSPGSRSLFPFLYLIKKKTTTPFPFLCCGDNAHATQGSLYNTYVHGCRIAVHYATQRNERPRHARSKPGRPCVSLVLPSTDKSYTKTCAFSSHRILQNLARCFHVINEKNVSCIPCTSSHTHTKKLDRR
jgi:hypothetical protein